MILAQLTTPLRELPWLHPNRVRQLERMGMETVQGLLTHFPRRYEDRNRFERFPTLDSGPEPVCVCGLVIKTAVKRLPGWKKLFEVHLQEENANALSPVLICRWFNAHYVEKMIGTGQRMVVYGKPKARAGKVCMDHPEFEVVENDEEISIHLKRITPVHAASEGISARVIRTLVYRTLENLDTRFIQDRLPPGLDDYPFADALRQIHFPDSLETLERARRHLVMQEFFAMQLFVAAKRAEVVEGPGESHCGAGKLLGQFHAQLPFPLTSAQQRAIKEIRADMASDRPMNRMLHGDVGSGKTVVAVSAMLLAVEAGYEAALMAPTQILAEQHYLNFKRWLAPLGVEVSLRTGNRKEDAHLPLFQRDQTDQTEGWDGLRRWGRIVVGTHALLYEGNANFSNLGLVIIDEQHKFGVLQRARLIGQAVAPDVLVMTATPIPRTLTMTVFGDLDVSVLDEMPANRGKIVTGLRDDSKLPDAVKFIREHLQAGRQAYIVYPLIEESEKLEAKAATREFERWRELLAPMECEVLHGRTEPEKKEAIMDRFRKGEIKALVATTVIEVGIDVPNANMMLIENAERFGLAQLHQLRGRIGRGEHKSYCVLLCAAKNIEAAEKLRILVQTSNGFEIAEADLRLRGPGDILGTAQSGLPPLKLGNLIADAEWMRLARKAARDLFAKDPHLERPENQRIRELLVESRKLVLSQVS